MFNYRFPGRWSNHHLANNLMFLNEPKQLKREAKARKIPFFNTQHWHQVNTATMFEGCLAKFSQNSIIRQQLMLTWNSTLVEASPYDWCFLF
jgi:ribA/ribD-fused uncharacterized protein